MLHVIRRIRYHWPRVEIAVRGDGHYGTPEVMDLLEDQGCGFILGLPGNARLSKIGQPWREDAAVRRVQSGRDKVRRFFQTGYRAKSWSRARKVIARVEATAMAAMGAMMADPEFHKLTEDYVVEHIPYSITPLAPPA